MAPPSRGSRLRRFAREEAGLSAVEFALVLPVMLLVALGIAEVGRFALLSLKLQHAANTLADLAARDPAPTEAGITSLFSALQHVLRPFDLKSGGVATISNVQGQGGGASTVCWQRRGGGALAATSRTGKQGGSASLPKEMILRGGETVIVAELFFRYQPWLLRIVPNADLRRVALFRPRLGSQCPFP